MAWTQQEYRTSPRSQQVRRRKQQAFEGIEEYDYAVDPRTGWRFFKPAPGNLSLSSTATISRQEVGILGILHGLTIRDFFLSGRTSFGWPGDKLPDNQRVCRQNTHSHDTFVHVQVIRTLPAQMCHTACHHRLRPASTSKSL